MHTITLNTGTSDLRQQLSGSASLLSALDAITRWHPLVMLLLTLVVCTILSTAFASIIDSLADQSIVLAVLFAFFGVLLLAACALVGVNATGIMLSDDVWERAQRNLQDALLLSLYTSHRLLLVLLLLVLVFFAGVLVLATLLFLTSIPGIGPLLYAIVYPLGSILVGMLWFAVFWVGAPIAAPAIWQGATIGQALVTIKAVAHYRLVPVLVLMLMLLLLLLLTGAILAMIIFTGATLTLGLSAGILDINVDWMGAFGNAMGGRGMGAAGDYLWALGLGSALLVIAIVTPVFLVYLKGLAIIHRSGIAGLDLEQSQAELDRHMEGFRRRADEAKAHAQAQAQLAATQAAAHAAAQTQAQQAQAIANAPVHPGLPSGSAEPATGLTCPNCAQAVAVADVFCGNCGYKLK